MYVYKARSHTHEAQSYLCTDFSTSRKLSTPEPRLNFDLYSFFNQFPPLFFFSTQRTSCTYHSRARDRRLTKLNRCVSMCLCVRACMYVCVCVCVCMCVCVCVYIYIYTHTNTNMYLWGGQSVDAADRTEHNASN